MSIPPVVSIQMITYNHAPWIRRAVESVLSQKTDFPFELVIGEDCSTDGTREIVFDYQRRFPDVVRVITSARNVGMHQNAVRTQLACRGAFLAFCEGDDFWHDSTKLQTQVEFLVKGPDYGMAHCNFDTYENEETRLRRDVLSCPLPLQDDNAYVEVLLRKRRIMTLTVCVRRELLDKVVNEQPECTDSRWPMGDTQRWLEICRLTKVKYFPKSMATHSFLSESASQSRDPAKAFRFSEKAGELILHYLKKYPIDSKLENQVRRRVALELMEAAFQAGDQGKVSFWMDQLRMTAGTIPVDAHLYVLGSQRSVGGLAARPAIWLLRNYRTAKTKFAAHGMRRAIARDR